MLNISRTINYFDTSFNDVIQNLDLSRFWEFVKILFNFDDAKMAKFVGFSRFVGVFFNRWNKVKDNVPKMAFFLFKHRKNSRIFRQNWFNHERVTKN